ncbi:universal stress protein [Paradesertivirga mongoliensis]|uniref:Universal stress protein n=1 Tax=Paradesertivirga mongoliensis TaxID=2100740 RepID=A0ABW4ZPA3_9SPHI|nr:universal stress protein [Pedobacter mongoliensis]
MTGQLKNIFVPVNFSESSDSAIYTAVAMCRRHGAHLHLVHIEPESIFNYYPRRGLYISLNMLKPEVEEAIRLEKRAQEIRETNHINCFFHTGTGIYHEVLAAKAKDFYCDLIILQKNSHPHRLALSEHSVYKILKHVSCPVLTIPSGKWALYFKNIFYPVRPIQTAMQKFEVALPIIRRNEAKVSLFAALKSLSEMSIAEKFIKRVDHLLSKDKIKIETEINSSNDAAKQVVKRAVEKNSDLIIISATIKSGFKSLFTHNYTERVINNSPIPVLSVKSS